jgi:hemerythrin
MTPVGWTPALAVGHPEIDAQHQELFRRVARLLEAMLDGSGDEVAPLFEFLNSYVVDHFAAEEALMQESGFPGYNVHRAAHERFVRDLHALRALHTASRASAAVAIKAQTWLVHWLKTHIASIDQQLARHLLARAG